MEQICCIKLYNSLNEYNVKNKIDIVTDLFKINKSTFYRWKNEYKDNNHSIFYNFNFLNATKPIDDYIVSYVTVNFFTVLKKLKKK